MRRNTICNTHLVWLLEELWSGDGFITGDGLVVLTTTSDLVDGDELADVLPLGTGLAFLFTLWAMRCFFGGL